MSEAKSDAPKHKVFVGGLSWNTTDAQLATFFSKFGEIKDVVVMKDKLTNASRGFGFVTFAQAKSLEKVLEAKDLELDGRRLECKAAIPREQLGVPGAPKRTKKLFVGGIPPDVKQDDFKDYFSEYGTITDAQLMIDSFTGRSRGFGFITFDSEDAVDTVVSKEHHLGGKRVECKRAVPQEAMNSAGRGRGRGRGMAAGRGGAFGFGYGAYLDPFAAYQELAGYGPYRDYFAAAPYLGFGGRGGGFGGASRGRGGDRSSRGKDRSYRGRYR